MAAVLFLLALLALTGGVALFVADSRERAAKATDSGEAPPQDPQPEGAQPRPVSRPTSRPSSIPASLPGGQRRERKAWADNHGFTFSKTDDLLVGEWHRGAAAGGAAPRDVLAGNAFGHDTRVADLGGTTVIAMTTGAVSPVVVDMRRASVSAPAQADGADDLASVAEVGDFAVFGTAPGAVRRFVDKRVRTALAEMPDAVAAVWCEGEWVLAELDQPGTRAWESVLAPLALIADAARTLPPADDVPFPHPDAPEADGSPPLQRPDTPVELPTRRTGGARGDFEDRELGDDDVEAIAGTEHRTDLNRVRRQQKPPSIFDEEDTHE